jgi:cell division septation protein DedD
VVLVLAAVVFVPMLLDQGGGSPRPMPDEIPAGTREDSTSRVVPLATLPDEPDPAGVQPESRTEPEPAVEAPPAKTVKVPTPPKTAPAAGFAVQLGSFAKAENAEGLRDRLVARGYKAFVKSAPSATRVYVGPQATRAEAEKVLQALLADSKLQGFVVQYPG